MAGINQKSYERIVQEIGSHIREVEEDGEIEDTADRDGYLRGLNHALLLIETYKDWHVDGEGE